MKYLFTLVRLVSILIGFSPKTSIMAFLRDRE